MADISKIKMNRIDDGVEPGDLTYSLRTYKNGWLLCDGQEVSRTDYVDLFEIIGTTFGFGDGTTTFNVLKTLFPLPNQPRCVSNIIPSSL